MKKAPYYKNWWIWVGVPLISAVATLLGTPHTIFDGILYAKMGLNLVIVAFIWLLNYAILLWMDKRMPWESVSHTKRWCIQLPSAILLGAAIDIGSIFYRNQFIEWPFSWHLYWYTDFPIHILFTSLLFYLYQQAYLKYHKQEVLNKEIATNSTKAFFTLKRGKKTYVIPVEDIAYFYRKDQLNYLKKKSGEEYILDESLTAIEQSLNPQSFFRINRQLLAHRHAISSFKVLANRQTELALEPAMETFPLLNKNRSSQFKKWLNPS